MRVVVTRNGFKASIRKASCVKLNETIITVQVVVLGELTF